MPRAGCSNCTTHFQAYRQVLVPGSAQLPTSRNRKRLNRSLAINEVTKPSTFAPTARSSMMFPLLLLVLSVVLRTWLRLAKAVRTSSLWIRIGSSYACERAIAAVDRCLPGESHRPAGRTLGRVARNPLITHRRCSILCDQHCALKTKKGDLCGISLLDVLLTAACPNR